MATHLPLFFNVLQTVSVAYRSYMLAVKLCDDHYPEGLFWDTDAPYHYIRTLENDGQKWLLVGGADHKTGHEDDTEMSYKHLEKYVRDRFNVASVDYRWSAQYYQPADGLPYIGEHPNFPSAYFVLGFGGNGIVRIACSAGSN